MKLIKPSYSIIEQEPGLEGIYKQIEIATRNCYKSEPVEGITSKDFVDKMIKLGHLSVLEHGTVYLKVSNTLERGIQTCEIWSRKYKENPYSKVSIGRVDKEGEETIISAYVTTNYRVLVENGWLDDLQYLCKPTEFHEKRVTVKFTTDIGVSREFNRHRVNSVAEQSTRYCNFSKDKFGSEISVCIPHEFEEEDIGRAILGNALVNYSGNPLQGLCTLISNEQNNAVNTAIDYWLFANLACEWSYMNLIRLGWKPQQARRILPLDLTTELIHTAFVSDWQHLFRLRTSFIAETGKPHQDASVLADPLYNEFKELKLI